MVAWGEGLGKRTALSARLNREAMADRLSPTVRSLSPTVTVCHNLPRSVSCSSDPWAATSYRLNGVLRRGVSMFLTGLVLWHSGISKRPEVRSVASDLFPENEGEGPSPPVTVCHINIQASRTMPPSRQVGNDGVRNGVRRGSGAEFVYAEAQSRGERIAPRQKRPSLHRASRTGRIRVQSGLQGDCRSVASLRSKDDNLPAGRDGRTTFGDNRRQEFEGQGGGCSGAWQDRQWPVSIDYPPEDKCWKELAVITSRPAARITHGRMLMRSGVSAGKSPVQTTKNDNSQNRLYSRGFRPGHPRARINTLAERRRDLIITSAPCRGNTK